MIGRPPSFRAEVREIDLIACEMTYIMRLISVTRERDEIKAHSTVKDAQAGSTVNPPNQ
jgi:hypothetical protein